MHYRRLLSSLALLLVCGGSGWGLQRINGSCQEGGARVRVSGVDSSTSLGAATYFQKSIPNCTVTVYDTGTSDLTTIYADSISTPLSNPFTADAQGNYHFYVADGTHVDICGSGLTSCLADISFSGGGSADFASPPPIGSTAPNTGTFTTVTASVNKVLNIVSYGAVGSGLVNDAVAINAAIAAAPTQDSSWSLYPAASNARSAKATIIQLPTPTSCYRIDSEIVIPKTKNISFVGTDFNGTRLCNNTGGNYLFKITSGHALTKLEGLVLDGGGIEIEGGARNKTVIRDVRIEDSDDYAIRAIKNGSGSGESIVTVDISGVVIANCRGAILNPYANNDEWMIHFPFLVVHNRDVSEIVISSTGVKLRDFDIEVRRSVADNYKWPSIWLIPGGSLGKIDILNGRFGNEWEAGDGNGVPQTNIAIGGIPATSMARSGNVVTISSSPIPHGFTNGQGIQLIGPTDASFATVGYQTVTVVDDYTFTFAQAAGDATAPIVGGMAAIVVRNASGSDIRIKDNYFNGTNSTPSATMANAPLTLYNPINASQFTGNAVSKQYHTAKVDDLYYPVQGSASSFANVFFGNTVYATVTTPDFSNGGIGWSSIGDLTSLTLKNLSDTTLAEIVQPGLTTSQLWTRNYRDYDATNLWRQYLTTATHSLVLAHDYAANGGVTPVDRIHLQPNSTTTIRSGSGSTCVFIDDGTSTRIVSLCPTALTTAKPFVSTLATGTAPFTIASTTAVTNLKAQFAQEVLTATNCSSAAAPAVCGSAGAGSVVIAAAGTTVTVNTTKVTANSQVMIQEDSSLGTKLGVTCNTTLGRHYAVTARTAATSFVITTDAAPVTNPACLSYAIVN